MGILPIAIGLGAPGVWFFIVAAADVCLIIAAYLRSGPPMIFWMIGTSLT